MPPSAVTYVFVEFDLGVKVCTHHVLKVCAALLVKVRHFAQRKRVDHIASAADSILFPGLGLFVLIKKRETDRDRERQTETDRERQTERENRE